MSEEKILNTIIKYDDPKHLIVAIREGKDEILFRSEKYSYEIRRIVDLDDHMNVIEKLGHDYQIINFKYLKDLNQKLYVLTQLFPMEDEGKWGGALITEDRLNHLVKVFREYLEHLEK